MSNPRLKPSRHLVTLVTALREHEQAAVKLLNQILTMPEIELTPYVDDTDELREMIRQWRTDKAVALCYADQFLKLYEEEEDDDGENECDL